jgi:uncharacterized protein YeaO (DUF488 family)
MAEPDVRVKRIYEAPSRSDGTRVLVDRIWPRGVTKAEAELDEWCKDVAPSTALRKWFGHDPPRFSDFRRRYQRELARGEGAQALVHLRELAKRRRLTLLTATKDVSISAAAILADLLRERPPREGR